MSQRKPETLLILNSNHDHIQSRTI